MTQSSDSRLLLLSADDNVVIARTKAEELGHQEFILTYKTFEPIGPACLPA
jgi:hypothetical protein